jgi:hypothetical protein
LKVTTLLKPALMTTDNPLSRNHYSSVWAEWMFFGAIIMSILTIVGLILESGVFPIVLLPQFILVAAPVLVATLRYGF